MERALVYWLWEETRVKEVVGSNPQMVGTDESTELPMAAALVGLFWTNIVDLQFSTFIAGAILYTTLLGNLANYFW